MEAAACPESGEAALVEAQAAEIPRITIKVQFMKNTKDLEVSTQSTVGDLKTEVAKLYDIPPPLQKLMFRGMLKNDADTVQQVGLKTGAKVMLIGTSPAEILSTATAAAAATATSSKDMAWDVPPTPDEPICKHQQHAKVIAKGRPPDGLEGVTDKQVVMPEEMNSIPGLLNSQGNKVRLTFKPEMQQIWLGSATSTQKVPYNAVSKIESFPIEGHEGYSIMSLQLGSVGQSKYWLYFVPSQYVAAIKSKILGLLAFM